MAQHNLTKLASQGRAYDESRPWTEEELNALITLETECGLTRVVAAGFVRNGIKTVRAYNTAKEVGFAPKSLEDLRTEAITAYSEKVRRDLGLEDETTPEVIVEETVIEEVVETTPEIVEEKKSKNKGGK